MLTKQFIQNHGVTTGLTPVTVVPAPSNNIVHRLKSLVVTNKDSVDVLIIVQMADGATDRIVSQTSHNGGVAATGVLTFAGNAANNETVIIGGKTYTFKDTIAAVDGHVDVGAAQADSEDQLTAAINLAAGGGSKYASETTAGATTAVDGAGTVTVTAKSTGAAGNFIATTESMGSGSWGAGLMSGGEDPGRLLLEDDIVVDSSTKSLELVLGWPVVTTECDYVVTYSREPATTLAS